MFSRRPGFRFNRGRISAQSGGGILPLGDSITVGLGSSSPWHFLVDAISSGAGQVFPRTVGEDIKSTSHHHGATGAEIAEIEQNWSTGGARGIVRSGQSYSPRGVVSMFGTNDVDEATPAAMLIDADSLLDAVFADRPTMPHFVMSIPHRIDDPEGTPVDWQTECEAYNYTESGGGLKALVEAIGNGYWVDIYPCLVQPDDFHTDGVHPNTDGYTRIARMVYRCVAEYNGLGLWNPLRASVQPAFYATLGGHKSYSATSVTNRGSLGGTFSNGSAPLVQTANTWEGDGTAKSLDSSLAASAWRFLHEGPVTLAGWGHVDVAGTFMATGGTAAGASGLWIRTTGGIMQVRMANATTTAIVAPGSTPSWIDAPQSFIWRFDPGRSPSGSLYISGTEYYSDSPSITPFAGDPEGTLRLGRRVSGGDYVDGKLGGLVAYNSWLSGDDFTNLDAFVQLAADAMPGSAV